MRNKEELADFCLRTTEARAIARTIFDKVERETVLKLIDDCEKLAASNADLLSLSGTAGKITGLLRQ